MKKTLLSAVALSMLSMSVAVAEMPHRDNRVAILPTLDYTIDKENGILILQGNTLKIDYNTCEVGFTTPREKVGFILPDKPYAYEMVSNQTVGVSKKRAQCVYEKMEAILQASKGYSQVLPVEFHDRFMKHYSTYMESGEPVIIDPKFW